MRSQIYTIEEIKEQAVPIFKKYGFIQKAFLFGSYSRNEATIDSDIDFFLVLDKQQSVGLQFFGIAAELEEIFTRKVDVLTLEEIRSIMPKAEAKGVMLYEKTKMRPETSF